MGKYEVEYAQFTKVEIEAESFQEARDIAATLDDEEITKKDPHEYIVWDVKKKEQLRQQGR